MLGAVARFWRRWWFHPQRALCTTALVLGSLGWCAGWLLPVLWLPCLVLAGLLELRATLHRSGRLHASLLYVPDQHQNAHTQAQAERCSEAFVARLAALLFVPQGLEQLNQWDEALHEASTWKSLVLRHMAAQTLADAGRLPSRLWINVLTAPRDSEERDLHHQALLFHMHQHADVVRSKTAPQSSEPQVPTHVLIA